jgi:hypothetical protein
MIDRTEIIRAWNNLPGGEVVWSIYNGEKDEVSPAKDKGFQGE